MENKDAVQKPALGKSAVPYGIIFGLIMIIELVTMFFLKPDPIESGWVGTLVNILNFLVFPFIFITLACNNYKNKINGGYISFGQCLKTGVAVCVVAAALYAVFYFIFNMIFPEFISDSIEQMKRVSIHKNPNMTAAEMEMMLAVVEKTMSPYVAGPVTIVMYAFVGLVESLIVGAFVKKENPYGSFAPQDEENNTGNE
ncbi:DUF4199 domain-containing protein [Flavobacterium hauense]